MNDRRPLIETESDLIMVSVSDVEREDLSYEAEYRQVPLIGFSPEGEDIVVSFAPALTGYRLSLSALRSLCNEAESRVAEDQRSPRWEEADA